ncbi:MAG: glycosyltransferase family 1 protein [Tepidisphaeraceae bacterium]|jgi:hypothetical protein
MNPKTGKLRIIVGGLVGQFPLGGVAWDYFHYVLGLHELGHEVIYHEDTWVWPYDPVQQMPVDKPDYTVNFLSNFFSTYAPALSDRWHYVLLHETHYGMTGEQFADFAKTADIFLNVSGACFIPEELSAQCVKVFLDTDPGYNQIMLAEKFSWAENVQRWAELVSRHDRHFTYAENMYRPDCRVPRGDFDWKTTRCVVTLPQWSKIRSAPPPAFSPMTTVMTWDWFKGPVVYEGVQYETKVVEYEKFHDLPKRSGIPLALAVGGLKTPHERIHGDGWQLLNAHETTLTPQSYQSLIRGSAGEWSVAKNIYVAMRTGWFSCRTACYLAAGRPAVVQDTGWSKFIPSGVGVVAFGTMDEALAGLKSVWGNLPKHRAAAYEIAREFLAPDRVLTKLIQDI